MSAFRAMGCDVVVGGAPDAPVEALFADRDARFSRFLRGSELNRVNARPLGLTLLSDDFAAMLGLALAAARATDGLVTPTVGAAVLASGYDSDFADLPEDGAAVVPAQVPAPAAVSLRGRMLLRSVPVVLDLNGVVKGATVDDALALSGCGWVSAGGDVATTVPLSVGLPGGGQIRLERGGLATSSTHGRAWRRGGKVLHHLIDPGTGTSSLSPWLDVSVAAGTCVAADVAAKAALLLGEAGPGWLEQKGLAGRFVGAGGRIEVTSAWPRPAEARAA